MSSRLETTPLGSAEAIGSSPGLILAGGSAGSDPPIGAEPSSCAVAPLSESGAPLLGLGLVRIRSAGCESITAFAPVGGSTFLATARRRPGLPGFLVGTVRWRS